MRQWVWLTGWLLATGCGGSGSETPPPVEPAAGRMQHVAQPDEGPPPAVSMAAPAESAPAEQPSSER